MVYKEYSGGKEEENTGQNLGPKHRCQQPIAQIITQTQYILLEREEHKILANKYTIYHKQTGYGSTLHGIIKHRYWLHHKDLDQ